MKGVLFITHISGFLSPGNGGQLRSHHLLKEIGRMNNVDVYCDKLPSDVESTSAWKALSLNRSVAPAKARRLRKMSGLRGGSRLTRILDMAFGSVPNQHPQYPANLLNKWCNEFVTNNSFYDVVILDTLGYYPLQSWRASGRKVWLNAHNVDSVLNPSDRRVGKLEAELTSLIDGVICCTENDEERFTSMNKSGLQTVCWGNGTAIPTPPGTDDIPRPSSVLFVGSLNYEPNITGLRWYLQKVHSCLVKADAKYNFTIVGRNPAQGFLQELRSYERVTVIPDAENLSHLYYRHSLSVVPILSGSGSRLKIPEGLIHGTPVISTTIGAEGYDARNVPGLTVFDTPLELTNAVINSFTQQDPTTRDSIQKYAAHQFTWSSVINLQDLHLD